VRLAGKQGAPMRVPLLALFALCLGLGIVIVVPISIIVMLFMTRTDGFKRWQERQAKRLEGSDLPAA